MSYFDGFFNLYGRRTMRSFTVPVELEPFERRGWRFADDDLPYVDEAIDTAPNAWVLLRKRIKEINPVSEALREAGLLGANPEGLWRPK